MPLQILVVDDEPAIREGLSQLLELDGYAVAAARDLATGLQMAEQIRPDLILLDRRLPDGEGVDAIERFRTASEGAAIVILTGNGDIETAVRAIKSGAANFLLKPVDADDLCKTVRLEAGRVREARDQRRAIGGRLEGPESIIGETDRVRSLRQDITRVAATDASVLLLGETGSGKGLAAEAIHGASPRTQSPFIEMNCAGIPANLLESELFGHERGAFTDARERKIGLFEAADRGTLFLDEIAEADLTVQSKLLKVLEQKRIRRLGSTREITVDFRLIAATSRDLTAEIAAGRFREDLFYRLSVVTLRIPSLRDRRDDIPLLARAIETELRKRMPSARPLGLSVFEELKAREWRGNIRELRNVIERQMILGNESTLEPANLTPESGAARSTPSCNEPSAVDPRTFSPLGHVIEEHIARVFHATGGNVRRTAEMLDISRSSLYAHLKKLGLLVDR